jgi:hypothetical protein
MTSRNDACVKKYGYHYALSQSDLRLEILTRLNKFNENNPIPKDMNDFSRSTVEINRYGKIRDDVAKEIEDGTFQPTCELLIDSTRK